MALKEKIGMVLTSEELTYYWDALKKFHRAKLSKRELDYIAKQLLKTDENGKWEIWGLNDSFELFRSYYLMEDTNCYHLSLYLSSVQQ